MAAVDFVEEAVGVVGEIVDTVGREVAAADTAVEHYIAGSAVVEEAVRTGPVVVVEEVVDRIPEGADRTAEIDDLEV